LDTLKNREKVKIHEGQILKEEIILE